MVWYNSDFDLMLDMVYEKQKERYEHDRQQVIIMERFGVVHGCLRAALEHQMSILTFTNRFMCEPKHKQSKLALEQPVRNTTSHPIKL
jgi:hypothetical protein